MNIKIRDVDPIAIKKIDELAEKSGVSRQKFLKAQLELLGFWQEQRKREMEFEMLLEKNIFVMQNCHESTEKMNAILNRMMSDE